MRHCILALVITVCGITGSSASADGLIFQLPPDGTWARYAVTTEGEFGIGEGPKQKLRIDGTLTISSVGQETKNEQKCRWIELKFESNAEGVHPKLLLKVLVPEDRIGRGRDPLAHAVLTFFNPKPVDGDGVQSFIEVGFNRIQYEIDRFRDVFPRPLDDPETLAPETIETPAGKFEDCEVLIGTSQYDGPLLNNGRSVYKSTYRIAAHPKSPFGVVSMETESEGREISGSNAVGVKATKTLRLVQTGAKAVTELPQKPPQTQKR